MLRLPNAAQYTVLIRKDPNNTRGSDANEVGIMPDGEPIIVHELNRSEYLHFNSKIDYIGYVL